MKKSFFAATMCSALALSLGLATASAQEAVSASDAEGGELYFVELAGKPVADGNSLANVRAEKARFLRAAEGAGTEFTVRRSYDTLFNGYAVRISGAQRAALKRLPGVVAVWPVETIQAPEFDPAVGLTPDLNLALSLTGADVVQNSLGYTGTGIKVAIMDTGVDYDHADLGGDGTTRSNSTVFPTARVTHGWDFVGDAYTAGLTPVPDPYPDDCNGHGSHVAGIVGANGTLKGVAPGVTFGAYRVFGCGGSTTADIMLAAMEMAYNDGMHVLNMSIGSRAQWPQYPTAAASSRLVKRGMVVVASIGNNGPGGSAPDGPYAAGAPGVGEHVIGVASYDNAQLSFSVSGTSYGYNQASASPAAPTSGSLEMSKTGTPTSVDDGCTAYADPAPHAGKAVLVRRGTCAFHIKALNAQNAGAAAVVLYNNAAGALNPTVAGTPAITIPVVAITAAQGATLDGLIAGGTTTLNWTSTAVGFPFGTGGLISGFSSFGMAADLSLKPDIGAPGGGILSTIPLEIGGFGTLSGTSMSSPHVAGAAALLLQAHPFFTKDFRIHTLGARLMNNANPTLWSGNPALGFLEQTMRQGAGMLDIEDAILATSDVLPGKLSLGESEAGPQTRRLTIHNRGASAVTYDLSHQPALAVGPKNATNFATIGNFLANAGVAFSAPSVTVPGNKGSATVDVTITAPGAPALGQYGGYVVLTPQGGGRALRVPYGGFIGDYQALPVLTPTANGFPWLAQLVGTSFFNRPTGGTYTMVGDDIPFFLIHLDHQSERIELTVQDRTGQSWRYISDDWFVGRNTTAGGFFAFEWDGTTFHGDKTFTVPNGEYYVTITVTKALGSKRNPSHQETWVSPAITIARP
ncbi:MAG: S8 family serine peptidase [Steroidobacteraceae bacterium]|nr:S8 family serine peptidase [Steroidobacteraceae bacterium]